MPWTLFPAKRSSVSKTTVDLLLLTGLMALFYGPPFLDPTLTSYGGDGLSLFAPALQHYRLAMYDGIIPLWNPYTWMGAPFLAPYQAGVLYPPQVLALAFGAPTTALNFTIFLSLLWLAFGAYVFGLRGLELERFPSLLMGVIVGCSGFVGGHTDHVNQLAAISWIPWIMCEAVIVLRDPRVKHAALVALCLGMQTLAGHPQYVIYTLTYLGMLVIIYSVYYLHRHRIDDPPSGAGVAMLGLAVVAGLGLGAAQILPSAELAQTSVRQLDPPERMLIYSFPPRHLITLILPNAFGNPATGLHGFAGDRTYDYNFGELVCYIGLAPLALAALAAVVLWKEFVVRCFLLLAIVSILIASGSYSNGFFYRLALFWHPGAEHTRVPARFMIFFVLSMAALAAVGFNQALFYLRERRRIRATTVAPLRLLIVVIAFGDLYMFSWSQAFRYHDSADIIYERGPLVDFLNENRGEYRVFRLLDEVPYGFDENRIAERKWAKRVATQLQVQRCQTNLNVLGRHQVCRGYEEGLLPTLSYLNFIERYRRNLYTPTPDTRLMGLLNIRYLVTDKPVISDRLRFLFGTEIRRSRQDASLAFASLPESGMFAPFGVEQNDARRLRIFAVYENLDGLPRFVWGEPLRQAYDLEALEVDDRKPERIVATEPRMSNMNYRLASDKRTTESLDRLAAEAATFDVQRPQDSPNAYVLAKPEGKSGELIMLSAAYPGWVCRKNGRAEPLRRVNAVMMACDVPEKEPLTITVSFEPFSFRLGLFLSCCFVMVLSGAVFLLGCPQTPPVRARGGKAP